jgi:hypothetical protein
MPDETAPPAEALPRGRKRLRATHNGMKVLMVLAGACFAGAIAARAADAFRSGPAPVALIELYTSEGCSSCPPAERWMADLSNMPGLWRDFVPVAFHVNYWDHLGWRDRLAAKNFTAREYAYAALWQAPSVYTPCFVKDGQEWTASDLRKLPLGAGRDAGVLSISWDRKQKVATVEFLPPQGAANASLDVSVALLGGGLVSAVRAGENAGRELRHEFVALALETRALALSDDGRTVLAHVPLPERIEITPTRFALAAWVTRHGKLTPIQAVGGWLD